MTILTDKWGCEITATKYQIKLAYSVAQSLAQYFCTCYSVILHAAALIQNKRPANTLIDVANRKFTACEWK